MSDIGFSGDLDRDETTARAHVRVLGLPRPALRERGDPSGITKGVGASFQEAGSWFRYVPRARVPSHALRGWSVVHADDPADWSVLMRWRGAGEPAAP